MGDIDPSVDPGWPGPRLFGRNAGWLLLGPLGMRILLRGNRLAEVHGLVVLRLVFVSFVEAIFLIGIVLAFIVNGAEVTTASTAASVAVGVVGGVSVFVGRRVARPLECGANLGAQYRTRFFLLLAFSEAAALLGFVAVFIVGKAPWLYVIGAAWALVGFALMAPTPAHIAEEQTRLRHLGCGESWVASLATPPPRS